MAPEGSDAGPREQAPERSRAAAREPAPERSVAFAPGRVNLIGEHTDYNHGLALPFAIADGVTVSARAAPPGSAGEARIHAYARDLHEHDEFELVSPAPAPGWRAFVRGIVAELARAGCPLVGAELDISGGLPPGAGLSSSAALEVALCLALADVGARARTGAARGGGGGGGGGGGSGSRGGEAGDGDEPVPLSRIDIARLCARVENDWVGAQTGLLDQLASLYGEPDTAVYIDFRTLTIEPVPLVLGDWRLVVLDSRQRHLHASSGYNQRRTECARACELLAVDSLRDATLDASEQLPEPLNRRARHVISENQRVRDTVAALCFRDLRAVGALLNASHASLRDDYDVSTPAVEDAVQRLLAAGASGARLVGGGFGGSVLGLFAPGVPYPSDARVVRPGPGAHLLDEPYAP
ncbi:MAG TPA: galactokinase family protein [Solirubrobacteraceae bacterium]|nr:galactokinase family protein [Solirubrobacteraceae bacterium]